MDTNISIKNQVKNILKLYNNIKNNSILSKRIIEENICDKEEDYNDNYHGEFYGVSPNTDNYISGWILIDVAMNISHYDKLNINYKWPFELAINLNGNGVYDLFFIIFNKPIPYLGIEFEKCSVDFKTVKKITSYFYKDFENEQ